VARTSVVIGVATRLPSGTSRTRCPSRLQQKMRSRSCLRQECQRRNLKILSGLFACWNTGRRLRIRSVFRRGWSHANACVCNCSHCFVHKCSTHYFGKITKWTKKEGFYVQPYNSSGQTDGPACAEKPDDVYLLPKTDRSVIIEKDNRKCIVKELFPSSQTVSVSYTEEESPEADASEAAAAAATPKKATPKKNKSKKKSTPKKRKTKGPQNAKAKKLKKPLDKASSSGAEAASPKAQHKYTLESVLASFRKRKGATHIWLFTYDCSRMIVHIWSLLITYDCSHMIIFNHIWLLTYDHYLSHMIDH